MNKKDYKIALKACKTQKERNIIMETYRLLEGRKRK